MHVVSSVTESYHLVLVGNQEEWQEPVLFLRACGASLVHSGGASHLVLGLLFNKQWLLGAASTSHAGDLSLTQFC